MAKDLKKMFGAVIGLPFVVLLMLLAFLTPSIKFGAEDLPVAVSGPEQAVAALEAQMEAKQPGAFDFTTYDSAQATSDAVANRDAVGAISVGQHGIDVVMASGAGSPYKQIFSQIAAGLQSAGQTVNVTDVAPLTSAAPSGIALSALALPLAFGGMVSAMLFTRLVQHRGLRLLGALLFSVVAGLAVAAVIQFGFDAVEGNYWEFALALAMGIAGTNMFVLGLESLAGMKGFAVGAILTMFLSNPLSGIATGWQWLPKPWGLIGQYLPIGAAGTAARSAAFFDGAGIGHSMWVLLGWIVIGSLLTLFASRHHSKKARSTAESEAEVEAKANVTA